MLELDSVLRDPGFRAQVAQLPGYEPSEAGNREPARDAFKIAPKAKSRRVATA
jgi:hypothetical protein